ncbi:MAG: DNA-processing protein DprA [Candidatus Parcubacteria bacterium]|nr:DNA-processing protein DprA [Candidatus Parcubacteria bacterium]
MKIQKIDLANPNYPKLLKEIYDPPKQLYVWGDLRAEENYPLAIVGTRKISSYGKQVTTELTRNLAKAGLTIISGLALGVDGLAHQACLDVGGRTIAVLGSGLKRIYPALHQKLAEKIVLSGGAVISEYEPNQGPTKWTFPLRNRIVAGMSLGTLVIEAPEGSGALITASCSLELGREVFAVPGNIYQQNSFGNNQLLKTGAKVVTSTQDVLDAFNLELATEKKEIKAANEEEKIILAILINEPLSIDEIIKQSKLEASIISSTLVMMEMMGKIKNLGGGKYGI